MLREEKQRKSDMVHLVIMGKLQRANAAGETIPPMVIYDTVNLSMVLVPMGGSTRNSLNDGSLSTLYKKLSLLALCSCYWNDTALTTSHRPYALQWSMI